LGIDIAATFYQAEHDMLATRAAATDTTHAARAEVALIDVDLAGLKRTFGFTEVSDTVSDTFENPVDALPTYTSQSSDL
jgi:hypothetical protein